MAVWTGRQLLLQPLARAATLGHGGGQIHPGQEGMRAAVGAELDPLAAKPAQLVPRGEFGRLPVGPVPFGPATDMVGHQEHVALKP